MNKQNQRHDLQVNNLVIDSQKIGSITLIDRSKTIRRQHIIKTETLQ